MSSDSLVFVLDDDAAARDAVCGQVRALGLRPVPAVDADEFFRQLRDAPGCLVAGLNVRTAAGAALAVELRQRGVDTPLVGLANGASTADIVAAMRNGAVTVLDKPPAPEELRQALGEALALDAQRRQRRAELTNARQRLASLSPKERDVLQMIVAGRPNKAMANHLAASLRTIENRRREVFTKLGVRSVAELVSLVLRAEMGG